MSTRIRLTLVISMLIAVGVIVMLRLHQELAQGEANKSYHNFVLGSIESHTMDTKLRDPKLREEAARTRIIKKMTKVMNDTVWLMWLYPDENIPTVVPRKKAALLGDPRRLLHQIVSSSPTKLTCGLGPVGPRSLTLCSVRIPGIRLDGGADAVLFFKDPAASGGWMESSTNIIRLVGLFSWLILSLLAFLGITWFVARPMRKIERALFRAAHYRSKQFLEERGGPDFESLAHSYNLMMDAQHETRDRIQYQVKALEQTLSKLSTTRDTLVRSEQLAQVGVMSASIAHEVGNPLGIVAGYAEMAKSEDLSAVDRAQYLTRIHAGIERIQGILRNLLDFSRHEGDMGQASADVSMVITQVLTLVRPQNRFNGVKLTREVEPGLPSASIPPGRLEQVLLNLVINAADAVGKGGLITVSAFQRGDTVVIRVQDDGPGVSETLSEKIFEPFVTTKPKGKGTGLGLFVCRHLVESYGGDLQLRSGAETGAQFEVVMGLGKEAGAPTQSPTGEDGG